MLLLLLLFLLLLLLLPFQCVRCLALCSICGRRVAMDKSDAAASLLLLALLHEHCAHCGRHTGRRLALLQLQLTLQLLQGGQMTWRRCSCARSKRVYCRRRITGQRNGRQRLTTLRWLFVGRPLASAAASSNDTAAVAAATQRPPIRRARRGRSFDRRARYRWLPRLRRRQLIVARLAHLSLYFWRLAGNLRARQAGGRHAAGRPHAALQAYLLLLLAALFSQRAAASSLRLLRSAAWHFFKLELPPLPLLLLFIIGQLARRARRSFLVAFFSLSNLLFRCANFFSLLHHLSARCSDRRRLA